MIVNTNKEKGRAGLSLAIAYYGSNGYSVNIPLNDTQWYDLLLEKDGCFYTVQCKCTTSQNKEIELRTRNGNKTFYTVQDHLIDFLFCLDGIDKNIYSIPLKEIDFNNLRSIKLRTKDNYKSGFPSYKYLVSI